MNRGKALVKLHLTFRQERILRSYLKKRKISVRNQHRVNIVLYSYEGLSVLGTSQKLPLSANTVSKWRNRWLSCYDELCAYEQGDLVSDQSLLEKMLEILSDAPRPGKPVQISASEKENKVALACKTPQDFGIPLTHWNRKLLAEVAMAHNLVEKVSPSYVSRILKKTQDSSS